MWWTTTTMPMNSSYLVGEIPETTSLLDLMPDPATDNGIFAYLSSLQFIEPQLNNIEYLYNRSGDKVPSPLVDRLADGDTLTATSLQSLANIVKMRYQHKWNLIWNDYISTSPVWNTLNIMEEETSNGRTTDTESGSVDKTTSGTKGLSRNTSDTTVLSGSHTDATTASDNSTATRTGSVSNTEGGTTAESGSRTGTHTTATQHGGTIGDSASSGTEAQVWGFNSSIKVSANANSATDSSTRTFNNTDTTTETPALADSRTVTHGKTDTTAYNSLQDGVTSSTTGSTQRTFNNETSATSHTGMDTTTTSGTDSTESESSKSGTSYLSRSKETKGFNIRNLSDKTTLMQILYTDPSFRNFWEVIYSDIDDVLTCPIFI